MGPAGNCPSQPTVVHAFYKKPASNMDCLEDLLVALEPEGPFDLNRQCHQLHLLELARQITEWKTLAPWLGFEATVVEDMDRGNRFDEEGKRQTMLRLWKETNGPMGMATYRNLATILFKSGRINLASTTVKLSKNDPGLLLRPINNYTSCSNSSSQRSSSYHTPHNGTPTQSHSPYSTAPGTPYRSAKPRVSGEHPSNRAQLVTTSPSFFPAPTPPYQESMSIEQQQQSSYFSQQSIQLQAPTPTQDPRNEGALCMTKPTPLVPHAVYEKVSSVCSQGPLYGLPSQTTTEMMRLNQRIQQLELERELSYERHNKELMLMADTHKREKQLMEKQLHEAHANAQNWELMVRRLMKKLEQMQQEMYDYGEREETDCPDCFTFEASATTTTTSSSSTTSSTSSHHEYSTVESYICREEHTTTVKYSRHYVESGCCTGQDGVEDCTGIEAEESRKEESRVVVRRLCRQITVCLEEKELRYKEKARSELATHHLKFLEANNKLTGVVSKSLESLNSMESVDDTPTDHEKLVGDLQWLQNNLEKCRLARHVSWP